MKTIFTAFVLVALLFFFDAKEKHAVKEKVINTASLIDTISFNTKVLPILRKNCSPCHFEGGKMFERMPFNQPATLVGHETVALRRFKDPNERAIVKSFLETGR